MGGVALPQFFSPLRTTWLRYWIVDPHQQQVTVCQWVEGQYENAVFAGDEAIVSAVIPAFNLTARQVLILEQ